jgi:CBS domain-containing protein
MTRNYISVNPDISLRQAAKIMIKKRVGSLVLEQEGKLKGLITEK